MVFVSFQAGQPAEHGLRSEEVSVDSSVQYFGGFSRSPEWTTRNILLQCEYYSDYALKTNPDYS